MPWILLESMLLGTATSGRDSRGGVPTLRCVTRWSTTQKPLQLFHAYHGAQRIVLLGEVPDA